MPDREPTQIPQHFVFALVEDFSHMAFSCAVDPLRIANLISEKELYTWSFASLDGKTATSSNTSVTQTHSTFQNIPPCDRLFVLSGINMQRMDHTVLVKAGFLHGRKAAVHWEYHDSFLESFPEVNVVRNVFVADEKYITASGGTATADLMLHLIERDHGYDLSLAVADQMVYNTVRDATSEQKVSLQSRNGMRNKHLANAIAMMRDSLEDPMSPAIIASEIGISTRQLERLFCKYLNSSPKKYFLEKRLDRARHLLLQTEMSIVDVAMACGFQSPGHFSRVFRINFGVTPMRQKGRLD